MDISDINSAKRLKFSIHLMDSDIEFKVGCLVRLTNTNKERSFFVSQFGQDAINDVPVSCIAGRNTAGYILDLLNGEECQAFRCMFVVEGRENDDLEVQAYTFQSITEYKTPIEIIVADELLGKGKGSVERLNKQFVWNKLGSPALFCMNYKSGKKRSEGIRFVGGGSYLIAERTEQGILARRTAYLRDKYDVPIDVFVAPQIRFASYSESSEAKTPFLDDLETISSPSSYFARWEAYNKLSKKLTDSESASFGKQPYVLKHLERSQKGTQYIFETSEEIDAEYHGRELGVLLVDDSRERSKGTEKTVGVGRIIKIDGRYLTTLQEYDEDADVIPNEGLLGLNTIGDQVILKRREAARDRMISNRSPIHGLVSLIETGKSSFDLLGSWGVTDAITTKFRRNFPKASKLNAEQADALSLALNTPDIALIQGPPGTGKTTVIKGICERFRESFEDGERQRKRIDPDYRLRSPRILLTSFQNEAVDNAISAPLSLDVPAFRKTSKRVTSSSRVQYQRSIEQWYQGLRQSVFASINNAAVSEFAERKSILADEYLSYKNAGEPIEKATKLIDEYLSYDDIPYPDELVTAARTIIRASMVKQADDFEEPIVALIESQKTVPEVFEIDGSGYAKRLAACIRLSDDLEIPEETLQSIQAVCYGDYTEEEFASYTDAIDQLRGQFCGRKSSVSSQDREVISECIMELGNAFSNHYANTLSSLEDKKSIILAEFLEQLEQDYEAIVEKYSMTTAATCQASMDLHEDYDKIYDLVIVDEAARANPLDLFIPMSMGRKVVLVGDQKQLPHMLEPDIVRMLEEELESFDVEDIEMSLFERLFNLLSEGKRPKAVKLTRQFRMHPDICRFVSESFYDGVLKTADEITPEKRSPAADVHDGRALAFIDVPITRGSETGGASKSRKCEVVAIVDEVRRILKADSGRSIGVITFYSSQAKLIDRHLGDILNDEEKELVETGTVDAFQGKEFDYVLLSCVRSNKPKDGEAPVVGFLEKPNRLCVAFSRAIRHLAVYGDAHTLEQIPCFSRLYDICSEGGGYLGSY